MSPNDIAHVDTVAIDRETAQKAATAIRNTGARLHATDTEICDALDALFSDMRSLVPETRPNVKVTVYA